MMDIPLHAGARDTADLGMIGNSAAINSRREPVRRWGPTNISVVILRPTGTGKEEVVLTLTALVPYIGYERAAALAKAALASGSTIRELAKTVLPGVNIDEILDAKALAGMGIKRELWVLTGRSRIDTLLQMNIGEIAARR